MSERSASCKHEGLACAGAEGASRIAEAVQTLDLNGNAARYAGDHEGE